MRQTLFTIAFALVAAAAFAQSAMPKPGPEYQRLAYFAGTWTFTGEAKAGPMGPAGPITNRETCEMMDGGFALVCRAEGKGPGGPTKSVSIMTYDMAKKAYTYTAAGSGAPVFTALGQVAGPVWTWTSEMSMGAETMKTKVTVREGGPTSYDFTMEAAVGKAAFTPMVSGKATKAAK